MLIVKFYIKLNLFEIYLRWFNTFAIQNICDLYTMLTVVSCWKHLSGQQMKTERIIQT